MLSVLLASCKSSKEPCDAYSIYWKDPRVDSITILKDNLTYVPYIPVMKAKEFHMANPERGFYKAILKDGNEVIEFKEFVLK